MASFKFYFLSALICGVLILGQAADVPTLPPISTIDLEHRSTESTTDTTTPTTESATTDTWWPWTTSTTKPTTTTTPTTTTSTPPPTTTTTTTPAPTTTTTTTTPAPTTTTTTTPAPTTTLAPPTPPKPIGPPDQGLWAYKDSKNVTCVIVQFAGQLNVTYPKPNTTNELYHVYVNVPANASVVSGNCAGAEQWLTISWPSPTDRNNTITVLFAKNDTTKTYEMMSLNASLVAAMFPNFTNADTLELHHGAEWRTPLASSYRCAAATELGMNEAGQPNVVAKLALSRLQEEAFRTQPGTGFSAARDCAGGDIPDAVPIAVGCALGGMVVVVLVAYLVARRRSAARGYLSM